MSDTTEMQADVEWPFPQQPINLGTLEDHPILLSVASHIDLDAIADFMTDSYLMIFKANCVGPPEYIETKWPIIRERHKSSLQAILDSCIPNEMTGVILKIEHRDMIQGVMAVNMAKEDYSDLWTNNEFLQAANSQHSWVFPTDSYLRLLSELIDGRRNRSRPILNVPHLVASLDDHYMGTCLTTFASLLKTIAHKCRYSVLINSHEGVYHPLFKTYMTYNTEFKKHGWMVNPGLNVHKYSADYTIYAQYIRPSSRRQRPYLDEALWQAFDDIFSLPWPLHIPHDDMSPVPSLIFDSGDSSPEPDHPRS
ncbi:hypothetical protein CIB48_g874 [Xylaria polymorpha]|nr:hypothetical protein CIB48_g874 [Xylaria polymorpha]